MASLNERLRRLEARIAPQLESMPLSRGYERFLREMNHARAVLDYEDRRGMAEAGDNLLEVGEPPEPLPPPTLDELKDDLESSLCFLDECIPLWREADQGPENRALIDRMERHARDEIERLRAEIRAREEGSEA